ncbi:MAG: SEC59/DGK1/VTE5 family protein [Cyanobacteriota bacterium]|nr:SEC59/DGK1/VTE5 family protein [Cyanobacteriota bacterium]
MDLQPYLTSLLALKVPIGIVALWLGLVVVGAEGLHRFRLAQPETVRKVVHIGAGNVILLAWWLQVPGWLGILAAIVAGTVALISYWLPILPGINSVGRKSLGTFFYAISMGVLIGWFFPLNLPQYAAIGILIMTWGDGMAAIVGQRWGRHRYRVWGMIKSWEGTLTMGLVSYAIGCSILFAVGGNFWQTGAISLVVAVVATGLEAFSKLGIDNLTVPIGSAAIAFFLQQSIG